MLSPINYIILNAKGLRYIIIFGLNAGKKMGKSFIFLCVQR